MCCSATPACHVLLRAVSTCSPPSQLPAVSCVAALGDRDACPAAALALRHLCEAAPAHLARFADALLGLYSRVAGSGPPPIANGGPGTAVGAWPMNGIAGDEEDVLQVTPNHIKCILKILIADCVAHAQDTR